MSVFEWKSCKNELEQRIQGGFSEWGEFIADDNLRGEFWKDSHETLTRTLNTNWTSLNPQ